jgi:hypothetical protein
LAYISQIHFAPKKLIVPCPHKATFFTMTFKTTQLIALFSFFSVGLFAQKYADIGFVIAFWGTAKLECEE